MEVPGRRGPTATLTTDAPRGREKHGSRRDRAICLTQARVGPTIETGRPEPARPVSWRSHGFEDHGSRHRWWRWPGYLTLRFAVSSRRSPTRPRPSPDATCWRRSRRRWRMLTPQPTRLLRLAPTATIVRVRSVRSMRHLAISATAFRRNPAATWRTVPASRWRRAPTSMLLLRSWRSNSFRLLRRLQHGGRRTCLCPSSAADMLHRST